MTLERKVRIMAGIMVLLSIALTLLVNPYWMFLTAFVGLNLIQSSFTGFCPAEIIIERFSPDTKDQA
jgi:hypothetical protein